MSVPNLGTYVSEDNNFKIAITAANPANGQIQAVYEAGYSPEGPFTSEGQIGNYAWVTNKVGGAGTAPFCIRFTGFDRPDGWPYCIYDSWTGAYLPDNTMLLEGVRSYVNADGEVRVLSLGTLTFAQ